MWNFKGYLSNSTQNIIPIHWKMSILLGENLRSLRFKSSYAPWSPRTVLLNCSRRTCPYIISSNGTPGDWNMTNVMLYHVGCQDSECIRENQEMLISWTDNIYGIRKFGTKWCINHHQINILMLFHKQLRMCLYSAFKGNTKVCNGYVWHYRTKHDHQYIWKHNRKSLKS